MSHLDFSLKIISPAFIAGAEEKDAELLGKKVKHRLIDSDGLRVPSLRGILRFWFRAKEGGSDYKALQESEAKIFGDADKYGQGVRIIPTGHSPWSPIVIGGSKKDLIKGGDALAYLGYGPLNYVSKEVGVSSHNKSVFRDAIPQGTLFHFRAMGNERQIEELKKCLLLLHLFGGVGSRSRRGWGSVAVISQFIPQFQAGGDVIQWFQEALRKIWPAGLERQTDLPPFSAFSTHTQIRTSQACDDYRTVMEEFHLQFKRVRLYNIFDPSRSPQIALDDHEIEVRDSDARSDDVTDIPRRIAFGMPYAPQSRNHKWKIEYQGYGSRSDEAIERRASPLFLKVFEAPNPKLYAVSLFLKAEFFSRSEILIGKRKKTGKRLPFPGWKAVEAYMNNKDWKSISLPV